jgi:hypothetical protein
MDAKSSELSDIWPASERRFENAGRRRQYYGRRAAIGTKRSANGANGANGGAYYSTI